MNVTTLSCVSVRQPDVYRRDVLTCISKTLSQGEQVKIERILISPSCVHTTLGRDFDHLPFLSSSHHKSTPHGTDIVLIITLYEAISWRMLLAGDFWAAARNWPTCGALKRVAWSDAYNPYMHLPWAYLFFLSFEYPGLFPSDYFRLKLCVFYCRQLSSRINFKFKHQQQQLNLLLHCIIRSALTCPVTRQLSSLRWCWCW